MSEKVKLSKDGSSIDFVQSDNIPTSLKKFRQSPEIEGFYRFIFENDLQKEAFEILDRIIAERKAKKAEAKAIAKAAARETKALEREAQKQAAKEAKIQQQAKVTTKTTKVEPIKGNAKATPPSKVNAKSPAPAKASQVKSTKVVASGKGKSQPSKVAKKATKAKPPVKKKK